MQKLVRLLAENLSCSQVGQDYWTKQHYALKAEEIGKTWIFGRNGFMNLSLYWRRTSINIKYFTRTNFLTNIFTSAYGHIKLLLIDNETVRLFCANTIVALGKTCFIYLCPNVSNEATYFISFGNNMQFRLYSLFECFVTVLKDMSIFCNQNSELPIG